jgi:hypothetical protein
MPASEVWLQGEVSLEEMLDDPIIRLVMERDGLDKEAVQSVFLAASARKTREQESRVQTVPDLVLSRSTPT